MLGVGIGFAEGWGVWDVLGDFRNSAAAILEVGREVHSEVFQLPGVALRVFVHTRLAYGFQSALTVICRYRLARLPLQPCFFKLRVAQHTCNLFCQCTTFKVAVSLKT